MTLPPNLFAIPKLLLQKELLVFKNTSFRTLKQIISTFVILAIGFAAAFGLTRLLAGWLAPVVEFLPADITAELYGSSIISLYAYITFLVMFTTMQECREKLLLAPELQMLLTVPASIPVLIVSRFLISVVFNRTMLIQMLLFCFPPLIAFGVIAEAPFYYYVLLAPLTYLFLIIPASLGVILTMLLVRIFTPKTLFRVVSFLGLVVTIGMVTYVSRMQGDVFLALQSFSAVFTPFRVIGDIWTAVLGMGGNWGAALAILPGVIILSVAGVSLTISKTFFRNAERLQTTAGEKPEKKINKALPGYFGYSSLGFLTFSYWRMAIRNREMAQGTLSILAMLAGYVIITGKIFDDGPIFMMLISMAAVAGLMNMAIQILFLPFAITENRSLLQQQYWIIKSSPIRANTAALAIVFANTAPALILGLPVLLLANFLIGISTGYSLLSLGILALVMVSGMTIDQWTILKEADTTGNRVPLITKIIREVGSWIYLIVILLPLAFGFYYRDIGFLSFMHPVSPEMVILVLSVLTVILALMVFVIFYRRMAVTWENMEIG